MSSWERDGYEEVDTEPVRLCHAKLCFCDHDIGRAHHSPHGLWEILKCDSCGHKVTSQPTAMTVLTVLISGHSCQVWRDGVGE